MRSTRDFLNKVLLTVMSYDIPADNNEAQFAVTLVKWLSSNTEAPLLKKIHTAIDKSLPPDANNDSQNITAIFEQGKAIFTELLKKPPSEKSLADSLNKIISCLALDSKPIIEEKDNLIKNLRSLQPTLEKLSNSGSDEKENKPPPLTTLPQKLPTPTAPAPSNPIPNESRHAQKPPFSDLVGKLAGVYTDDWEKIEDGNTEAILKAAQALKDVLIDITPSAFIATWGDEKEIETFKIKDDPDKTAAFNLINAMKHYKLRDYLIAKCGDNTTLIAQVRQILLKPLELSDAPLKVSLEYEKAKHQSKRKNPLATYSTTSQASSESNSNPPSSLPARNNDDDNNSEIESKFRSKYLSHSNHEVKRSASHLKEDAFLNQHTTQKIKLSPGDGGNNRTCKIITAQPKSKNEFDKILRALDQSSSSAATVTSLPSRARPETPLALVAIVKDPPGSEPYTKLDNQMEGLAGFIHYCKLDKNSDGDAKNSPICIGGTVDIRTLTQILDCCLATGRDFRFGNAASSSLTINLEDGKDPITIDASKGIIDRGLLESLGSLATSQSSEPLSALCKQIKDRNRAPDENISAYTLHLKDSIYALEKIPIYQKDMTELMNQASHLQKFSSNSTGFTSTNSSSNSALYANSFLRIPPQPDTNPPTADNPTPKTTP